MCHVHLMIIISISNSMIYWKVMGIGWRFVEVNMAPISLPSNTELWNWVWIWNKHGTFASGHKYFFGGNPMSAFGCISQSSLPLTVLSNFPWFLMKWGKQNIWCINLLMFLWTAVRLLPIHVLVTLYGSLLIFLLSLVSFNCHFMHEICVLFFLTWCLAAFLKTECSVILLYISREKCPPVTHASDRNMLARRKSKRNVVLNFSSFGVYFQIIKRCGISE